MIPFVFDYSDTSSGSVTAVIQDFDPADDKLIIRYNGVSSTAIASTTSGSTMTTGDGTVTSTANTVDLIWRDTLNGGFRITLKSARDNDYFDGTLDAAAWDILELTNQERENRNLPPLTMSDGLTKAASVRVNEIYNNGSGSSYISHTRPDGTNYDTVFEDEDVGKTYLNHAENILTSGDPKVTTAADAVAAWMDSASHSVNVVNTNFQKLGVGYIYEDSSDYEYYYEQLFAESQISPAPTVISAADMAAAGYNNGSDDSTVPTNPVTLTTGDDTYANSVVGAGAAILALEGNDSIINTYASVSIDGSTGNDTIENSGNISTINAGAAKATTQSAASTATTRCKSAAARVHTQRQSASLMSL